MEDKNLIEEQNDKNDEIQEESVKDESAPNSKKFNFKYIILGIASLLILVIVLIAFLYKGDDFGKGGGTNNSGAGDNSQTAEGEDTSDGSGSDDATTDAQDKEKEGAYSNALSLIDAGKYREAYSIFADLGDFKDAKKQLSHFANVTVKAEYQSSYNSYSRALILGENNLPIAYNGCESTGYNVSVSYIYDEKDALILQRETQDGVTKDAVRYSYNENGMINKIAYISSNLEDSYRYDEYGRKIEQTSVFSNGDRSILSYEYDANGNVISMAHVYYLSGFSKPDVSTYTYTYDDNGNMLTESYSAPWSNDYYNDEYIYDEDGRLIKYSRVGNYFNFYNEYTYDENGYLISMVYYHSRNGKTVTTYTNDANGRAIKAISSSSKGETTEEFTYDDFGNVLSQKICYYNGNIETYEYEYEFVYIETDVSEAILNILNRVKTG